VHIRTVRLDRARGRLELVDRIEREAPISCRLPFHLGPSVQPTLAGSVARLEWSSPAGVMSATIVLPRELTWALHRGETDPVLGWYSPHFGIKQPAWVILGAGMWNPGDEFVTILQFG
jgi:hypothetical protein